MGMKLLANKVCIQEMEVGLLLADKVHKQELQRRCTFHTCTEPSGSTYM